MPDIEKVINGLEMCISSKQCSKDSCPYYEHYEHNASGLCWDILAADALALLKERKKTPVVFSQYDGSITTACGNCGWDLDKAYSICPNCKKELDWNALQE